MIIRFLHYPANFPKRLAWYCLKIRGFKTQYSCNITVLKKNHPVVVEKRSPIFPRIYSNPLTTKESMIPKACEASKCRLVLVYSIWMK